jgi:hypothetical protein
MGALRQHVKCMEYLYCIQCMLFSTDVSQRVRKLRELVASHHILFAQLYPSCIRPKLHYLHHVVDGIEAHQKHISCFSTERKHKMPKSVAAFAFCGFAVTVMVRCALAELDALTEASAVAAYALLGKVKVRANHLLAVTMRTPQGVLARKEFALADGIGVIFFNFGVSLTLADAVGAQQGDFFAMVRKCVLVAPGRWRDDGGELSRLPLTVSLTRCTSMRDGSDYLPVLPAIV